MREEPSVAAAAIVRVAAAMARVTAAALLVSPMIGHAQTTPSARPGTPAPPEPAPSVRALGCSQQLTFLGVTAGDPPVAWITEDIGGACGFSFLIQLAIEPDTVRASVTSMSTFAEWEWLARGLEHMGAYTPPDTPGVGSDEPADGVPRPPDLEPPPSGPSPVIRHRRPSGSAPRVPLPAVIAPPASEAWHTAFLAHLDAGGSDAVTWNAERGAEGILPPALDGEPAEVAYAYAHGLYVNYDVARVESLPGRHVLVFTSQPALGLHHNTMHGFLVVRLTGAPPRASPRGR